MFRRDVARAVAFAMLLALAWGRGASPVAAAGDDGASVERGRSRARVVLIFRNPRICAPMIRVALCIADLASFAPTDERKEALDHIQGTKPHAYDRLLAYVRDGDATNIDTGLAYLNEVTALPTSSSKGAILEDGGITATLLPAALGSPGGELLSIGSVVDAAKRETSGKSGYFTIAERAALAAEPNRANGKDTLVTLRPEGVAPLLRAAHSFAEMIDAEFPSKSAPAFVYDESPLGYVRLGIAISTLNEFPEVPEAAALPENRAFIARTIERLEKLAPAARADDDAYLAGALARDFATRHAAQARFNLALEPLLASIPPERKQPFLIGFIVAQVGYNAATFRDSQLLSSVAGLLRSAAPLGGAFAANDQALTALAACAGADFSCQRRSAAAFVNPLLAHWEIRDGTRRP